MKICFISPFAYSLFNESTSITHGGSEIDLFLISSELAKYPNFSISLIVGDFRQPNIERHGAISIYRSFRVDVHGWKRPLYGLFFAVPKLFFALRRANADIYVQEGVGLETAIIAFFCRLNKRQFVYRIASTIDYDGTFRRQQPFTGLLHAWGVRQANLLIAQNQMQAEACSRYLNRYPKVIYNATKIPDISVILPLEKRRYILWVGRLIAIKHPEKFIDLAKSLPYEKFLMVASLEAKEREMEKETRALSADISNFTFIPNVPHRRINDYYQKAKILVNTSEYEGYPNTFIEAGKYGTPLLSLVVNPDNMLTKHRIGACANGDVNTFRRLLSELLRPDQWAVKSREIRQYVEHYNDPSNNARQYLEVFTQLIKK